MPDKKKGMEERDEMEEEMEIGTVVKLATGRVGPRQTHNTHDILAGGDIYPSGHVSNAVVLYGLIALIAITYRKLAVSAAVFLSVTVGLGTVYLDTHWFSAAH